MKRRTFITKLSQSALMIGLTPLDFGRNTTKVTILHTNDVHSRLDPFPMDGSRNQGKGGVARRAALIESIREENPNTLLFDSGDIFQGTPYFNLFGGAPEIQAMTLMKYDAATLGNHDFDGGMDGFVKQLSFADFPFLIANYNLEDTPLFGKTQPFKIFKKGGVKIGVFGLGIELKGLVPQNLYGNTQYLDPIKKSEEVAGELRYDHGCDYVICLSHLGYRYNENKISDIELAKLSKDIDLILGGHTHTFMKEPEIVTNKNGEPVIIHQAGWGGILLGRVDLYFEKNKKGKCITCKNLDIS
jgi:5'-nucleotidase